MHFYIAVISQSLNAVYQFGTVVSYKSCIRYNCFSHRVIRVWNILPECVNFSTNNAFKQSLTTNV